MHWTGHYDVCTEVDDLIKMRTPTSNSRTKTDPCANTIKPGEEIRLVIVRGICQRAEDFVRAVYKFRYRNYDVVQDEVGVVVHGSTVVDACNGVDVGAARKGHGGHGRE